MPVTPGKREVPEASAAAVSKRCRSGGGGGGSERSPRKPAQGAAPTCAKLASCSRHLNIREKAPLVPGHARYALKRGLAATAGGDSGGDDRGGAACKRERRTESADGGGVREGLCGLDSWGTGEGLERADLPCSPATARACAGGAGGALWRQRVPLAERPDNAANRIRLTLTLAQGQDEDSQDQSASVDAMDIDEAVAALAGLSASDAPPTARHTREHVGGGSGGGVSSAQQDWVSVQLS